MTFILPPKIESELADLRIALSAGHRRDAINLCRALEAGVREFGETLRVPVNVRNADHVRTFLPGDTELAAAINAVDASRSK